MNEQMQYRALVIDDERAIQKLFIRALEQVGFRCDSAADGIEAKEYLLFSTYDLVITDFKMPNTDGYSWAAHLFPLTPRPVIIVHTGVNEPNFEKELRKKGADDIYFKPIDFSIAAENAAVLVHVRSSSRPCLANCGIEADRSEAVRSA